MTLLCGNDNRLGVTIDKPSADKLTTYGGDGLYS